MKSIFLNHVLSVGVVEFTRKKTVMLANVGIVGNKSQNLTGFPFRIKLFFSEK